MGNPESSLVNPALTDCKVEKPRSSDILGCKCFVVHEQKVDIGGVVDEKGFMAGRH